MKVGDIVRQGTVLAKMGKLLEDNGTPKIILSGKIIYMLHLEYYSGSCGLNLKKIK